MSRTQARMLLSLELGLRSVWVEPSWDSFLVSSVIEVLSTLCNVCILVHPLYAAGDYSRKKTGIFCLRWAQWSFVLNSASQGVYLQQKKIGHLHGCDSSQASTAPLDFFQRLRALPQFPAFASPAGLDLCTASPSPSLFSTVLTQSRG